MGDIGDYVALALRLAQAGAELAPLIVEVRKTLVTPGGATAADWEHLHSIEGEIRKSLQQQPRV